MNTAIKIRDSFVNYLSEYKKYNYAFFIVSLLSVPYYSYYLFGANNPEFLTIRAWLLPLLVFGLIPIVDYLLGEDTNNLTAEEEQAAEQDPYYKWLTVAVLPAYALTLIWGLSVFVQWELNWFQQLGWIVTIGTCGGAVGIVVAHELVHKTSKLEQTTGGLLLSLVSYAGFKVEHVYGHHVHVSTVEDASSSRYNQSLYDFLPRAYVVNFKNAWKIQKKRMQKKNQKFLSFKNELINYYLFSLAVLIAFTLWQGWLGAIYFLGTSFVAFTLLEIVNYIEHYGLHRELMDDGRYERVKPHHSWNANHIITNLFLVHLQRHSDHHAYPKRRYQVLRNFDDVPTLPSGYAGMVVLALVPPLWKKVMNPRVEAYYQGRDKVLDAEKKMLKRAKAANA